VKTKQGRAAAIAIGDDFVKRHHDVGPCDGAEREAGGWVLTYPRRARDGEATDPSHVIVLVDLATREARFFDIL
jgi:hypothetical protein